MAIRLSTGLRNKINDSGLADAFDTNGRINIYSGAQPASANDAATGTLLATLTLAADAVTAASSGGVLTFAAIGSDTSIDASGTPGWFRVHRASDTAPTSAANTTDRRYDGNIGTSGADLNFDSVTWVAGGTVAISSLTLTLPAG